MSRGRDRAAVSAAAVGLGGGAGLFFQGLQVRGAAEGAHLGQDLVAALCYVGGRSSACILMGFGKTAASVAASLEVSRAAGLWKKRLEAASTP